MIFKKIKTLVLASLSCTVLTLMPMEKTLQEPASAVIAVEEDSVDAQPQLPAQEAFNRAPISSTPEADAYLNAQWAYFWNYAIAHLEHCPPELLRPLAEKALNKEALIRDKHLSSFFAGALSRKNKRAELPPSISTNSRAPKDLPESPLQSTDLPPFKVTTPMEPAVNSAPAPLPIPEKDAVAVSSTQSHKKQKKQKEPIWHYESGGSKKAGIEHHAKSIIADPPLRDHSKWTAALLYEVLKEKGLYFEWQDLEIFINKTDDQNK